MSIIVTSIIIIATVVSTIVVTNVINSTNNVLNRTNRMPKEAFTTNEIKNEIINVINEEAQKRFKNLIEKMKNHKNNVFIEYEAVEFTPICVLEAMKVLAEKEGFSLEWKVGKYAYEVRISF